MSRRSFVAAAATVAAAPASVLAMSPGALEARHVPAAGPGSPRTRTSPFPQPQSWPGYGEAVVVDCLASPGYFNYPEHPPLDDAMIANAVGSGITGVNLTVGGSDFEGAVTSISQWMKRIQRFPDALMQVRTVDQLMEAKATERLGLIFGYQDTVSFEGELDVIEVYRDLGVRIAQLTYNIRNMVGDGCLEPANAGLSRYGFSVVERLNELGMVVDVSHCGQRTTAQAIEASTAPVAITHSGCNAVAPHPRGKDDAELRALAEKGGVMGIYLMPFLTPGRVATTDDVLDHLEHAIQVCGEDHVGIGSDLSTTPIDGSEEYWSKHREFVARRIEQGIAAPNEDPEILFTVEGLNSHRRMELIAAGLARRGHGRDRILKVLGGNWVRLFREVWGA